MTPINWDDPDWGNRVHIASWCTDAHDKSEQAAEDER